MAVTKAVILAAGEGSRMRPLTYTRPKVMLPIAGKPILEHLVLEMRQAGIKDIIMVVGYHDEQIRDYFTDGHRWNVSIQYSQQRKQMGTADAVRQVQNFVTGRFLVANGDILVDRQDITKLIEHTANAISVVEMAEVSGLGVVEIKDGTVLRIHEKSANPPGHMVNAGLYVYTQDIFEAINLTPKSERGEYELTDSLQILINKGKVVEFNTINRWYDLSYPWHLLNTNEKVMANMEPECAGEIEANVVMKGAVIVGKGTLVRSGAYIVGPVIIGKDCDIGPNCFIRPYTTIGDNCHIGAGVEVKNSIVMSGTKIPHLSYVGDSIIGENCNLGAGTKIANLKLNKKNIMISGMDTGRRKMGAVIGDRVETGINASINVGTMIGNNCMIGPGAFIKGIIEPRTKLF